MLHVCHGFVYDSMWNQTQCIGFNKGNLTQRSVCLPTVNPAQKATYISSKNSSLHYRFCLFAWRETFNFGPLV